MTTWLCCNTNIYYRFLFITNIFILQPISKVTSKLSFFHTVFCFTTSLVLSSHLDSILTSKDRSLYSYLLTFTYKAASFLIMVSQIESTTLRNNAYKYNPRYTATVLDLYYYQRNVYFQHICTVCEVHTTINHTEFCIL